MCGICVCVCVCVREREREVEKGKGIIIIFIINRGETIDARTCRSIDFTMPMVNWPIKLEDSQVDN